MQTNASSSLRRFLYYWFMKETVARACKVAAVVGFILTGINQHDVLLRGDFSLHLFIKIGLTFMVPYSVSSFSSARAYMDREALSARENV
ncbi:MAG: nitrate/nitrite transporter NrtS [Candidatus Binatia bacterium]